MNFFCIRESLDKRQVGIYPQVEEALYSCDVWNEPKFVDGIEFKKVDFEPIVAKAILRKKAKPSDLISAGIIGFHLKLLMSDKLKIILEKSKKTGLQFAGGIKRCCFSAENSSRPKNRPR